jgi:C-terminal processing protease CtpA/Prc
MKFERAVALAFGIALFLFSLLAPAPAQQISDLDRERDQQMLRSVGDEVLKHYYDPKLHGVDFNAELAAAKQRIDKANSNNMALSSIAAALDSLDDSHTFFVPPQHAVRHDYGWEYQMFGDRCFVTQVRPKSDAEAKGLKPGDEIVTINGIAPARDTVWKLRYLFGVLRPQPGLRLALRDPAGNKRTVDVAAFVRETKRVTDLTGEGGAVDIWNIIRQEESEEHLMRARYAESGDAMMVLKVPEFDFSAIEVREMMDKARKHKALIVDLRGNPGGSVETIQYFAGDMFDKGVKIADRVGRKESKPQVARGSHNPFAGKLVVLVDSKSASAAELFARLMQIEKRGIVLGDRSSGHVMESRRYSEQTGVNTVVFFGVSVTDADLIMTDGKSLEHVGVTPDELILPTAADLASGRDPVMARAAELLGVKMRPEDAGKLFPYEWPEQ